MITAYAWDSNWKITLLVLILVPILTALGFWQLSRAEDKGTLQQYFELRSSMPPIGEVQLLEFVELSQATAHPHAFRRVALSGRYLNEKVVVLDNQIFQSRVGYYVLTPLKTVNGAVFLINRGWIAGKPDRSLPVIPMVNSKVDIIATVYVPDGDTVVLSNESWTVAIPLLVQRVSIERLNAFWNEDLFNYELRLQPGFAGGLDIDWPVINTRPEKHMGYAVQWFFMAVAVLGFWVYSSLSRTSKKTQ